MGEYKNGKKDGTGLSLIKGELYVSTYKGGGEIKKIKSPSE